MTGLLLVAIVALWAWLAFKLGRFIGRKFADGIWATLLATLIFVVLLTLPVADEIVGGFQFRALCNENASEFRLGVSKPEGRTTRYSADPVSAVVPGTAIDIYETRVRYTDVESGEAVVEFHRYHATGGIVVRTLGISQGSAPITMGRASCSPEQARGEVVSRTLKFSVVN